MPKKIVRKYTMSKPAFAAASAKLIGILASWLGTNHAHALVSHNNQLLWVFPRIALPSLAVLAGFTDAAAHSGAGNHLERVGAIKVMISHRRNRGLTAPVAEPLASIINHLASVATDPGVKSCKCLRVPTKEVKELGEDTVVLLQKFGILKADFPDGHGALTPGVWEFCPPTKLTPELRETFNKQFYAQAKKRRRPNKPAKSATLAATPTPKSVLIPTVKAEPTPTPVATPPATMTSSSVQDAASQLRANLTVDRDAKAKVRKTLDDEINEIDRFLEALSKFAGA